jgi:bifunctional non-homologous end joining protein LigD
MLAFPVSHVGAARARPGRQTKLESGAGKTRGNPMTAPPYPLTHPDKILYAEQGITKRELYEYYALVADRLLPHVRNRPLTLVRCPNGSDKPCFFQKHPGRGMPGAVHSVIVPEKHGRAAYGVIDDREGLFALVQYGVLEIHTWGSRITDLEHPDIVVLDLDPDPTVPHETVIEAAHDVGRYFERLGLQSFAKTSGGKGFHVCVPIVPEHTWDEVRVFARRAAETIAGENPERYVTTASKALRRGKIFIDYLRNGRGATFVAPYSTRARKNAPISMPLPWDQVSPDLRPETFTLRTVTDRLAACMEDPSARLEALAQRLELPPSSAPGTIRARPPGRPARS